MHVAPLAGAWIEMGRAETRSRCVSVAPLAGAWIEILQSAWGSVPDSVAPLAGAWIEISTAGYHIHGTGESPPSRGRGLK